MSTPLLDQAFLRKLEQLSLLARRVRRGVSRGEHSTIHHGASLEFSDYRHYEPGDDFRYLDWGIYARLGRLFVKVFTAEENLTVHILVDTSRSMEFGTPSKLWYAARLAAALGYLAVHNLDRVGVSGFAEGIEHSLPPIRMASEVTSLFDYVQALTATGKTDFNRALRDYSLSVRRPGLAVLISDLLDPAGYEQGLKALLYRRFDVMVIHVLEEQELAPSMSGMMQLVDVETGQETTLTVGRQTAAHYHDRLSRYFGGLESFCRNHEIEYVRTTTAVPFEEVVLGYLRRGVFVR